MTQRSFEVDIVIEQLRRPVPGGIGTYCRGLLKGLSELGGASCPPITLRAGRPRALSHKSDPLSVSEWPLRSSSLPGVLLTRLWDRGIPAGWLSVRDGSHLLVHGTSLAVPPLRGPNLVVMVHDLAWRRHPDAYPARGRAWHESALRRAAKFADAFVVPSALTAADLVGAGVGITEDRVHVIAEGADHLRAPDLGAADELLAGLGGACREGFLLTVSTLEPRKNLAILTEAYELARPRLPAPWPLLVVGPSGWGDSGIRLGGQRSGIVPLGHVSDAVLAALYSRARCVAYVPKFEGFGLPAGEAMAAGSPVVATAGLPSSAGAALEVDPSDVIAIADALVIAATDSPARDALRTSGLRRAGELTWAQCAGAHVQVWQEVAA
ncbi:MAG: glycosyltransferase family 4 protein [Acidimicrobiales bacterium]